MTSLYNYTKEFLEIKEYLESMDLDADVMQNTLETYEDDIKSKAENIIKFSEELKQMAEMQKAESKRWLEASKQKELKAQHLLDYLDENLKKMEIDELQAGLYKVKYLAGTKSTYVDTDLLPKKYWVKQKPVPMTKPELKKLVDAGEKIPGVKIITGQPRLQVKL